MEHILNQIADKYNLRRHSGRWKGPCPKCGGSSKSDKFVIQDDGGFKCHACQFKGDIITWLKEMEGKNCPEAHLEAGLICKMQSNCRVWDTCRMGNGTGKRPARRKQPLSPQRAKSNPRTLPITQTTDPAAPWVKWATDLVLKASENIKKQPVLLKWLASRGIDSVAVARFRIGWLGHQYQIDRKSIGLPPGDNDKPTLWVPKGLLVVIPAAAGTVHRVRIRRTKEDMDKFLPDLKYYWVPGGGTGPFVIRPAGKIRGVVIIEAELDAIATASAHDQVMVIALGTVSTGLPDDLREDLHTVPIILVALDAETGKDGKQGAGPEAFATWRREFRQAKYWPVPTAKDPGEYYENGGDLHAWIEAGLVPELAKAAPRHDLPVSPDCYQQGGEGKNNSLREKEIYREVVLKNGRKFYVTESQDVWNELVDDGEIVFSENELSRLSAACKECNDEGAKSLANGVLDLKAVFSGAYIKRGGKVIDHHGYEAGG